MSWASARDFAASAARLERERLLADALALRAGQADEKGWKRWVKGVSGVDGVSAA